MAFDGIVTKAITTEITPLCGARIDKVFEPNKNEIILGFRKLDGIDIVEFFNKYHTNIQDEFNITPLLKNGLLVLKDNMMFIRKDKVYVMNTILNEILK